MTAKWTFMAYIAGDNNLDPAALDDIGEMAKVGSSDDLHVVVQLDRAKDRKTRRFYITEGGGYHKDCIECFGETNTGDPKVLEDFILWGMGNFPASRYVLVIWNHGGGKFFNGRYVDLHRFAEVLCLRCGRRAIKDRAGDLLRALRPGRDRAIIHQRHLGRRLRHTRGMSIYFPMRAFNPKYRDLDFAGDFAWGSFLERYLGSNRGGRAEAGAVSRAGRYGLGFAGNPWRDKTGRFADRGRDADGTPYT